MSRQEAKKRRSASAKAAGDRVYAHVRVHGLGATVEARERGRSWRPTVLLDESGHRVVSASPAAEGRGVRAGMSLWEAQRRCPEVVAAEANEEKHEYFWRQVVEICGDYSPGVREIREAGMGMSALQQRMTGAGTPALQLDLTGTERLFGPAQEIGQEIRNRLRAEVGLTASVGIGPNRMVARLACESARPGEVLEVGGEDAEKFVGRLAISALPGISEDWVERFGDMGIRQAKDLAALPGEAVRRALGEWGGRLWEIARGGDPLEKSELGAAADRYWEQGVFSVQFDLRPPTDERGRIRAALRAVTEEVGRRLRQRGQAAGQVKLTLVFRDMRKVGVRRTVRQPMQSGEKLFQAAGALLERMKLGGRAVRRVRVTVAHLAVGPKGGQMGLPLAEQEERRERLAERVDQVKDRYGEGAVRRASLPDGPTSLVSSSSGTAATR